MKSLAKTAFSHNRFASFCYFLAPRRPGTQKGSQRGSFNGSHFSPEAKRSEVKRNEVKRSKGTQFYQIEIPRVDGCRTQTVVTRLTLVKEESESHTNSEPCLLKPSLWIRLPSTSPYTCIGVESVTTIGDQPSTGVNRGRARHLYM